MKTNEMMKCKVNFRQLLAFLLVIFLSSSLWAQKNPGKGSVVDTKGLGISGVTVVIKGTQTGTITDEDGYYFIKELKKDQTLLFSFLGFEPKELKYNGGDLPQVLLKESVQNLDGVVVVGYMSQKKSNLTAAVSPVNMGDVEARRVPTVSQALQGQIAGVQVTQSTGAPGDGIEVRIRGLGTVGNNDPLYIVDGTPATSINFLNPSNIASMTVLKDAAAAAIYGSRAANGVVVITTKTGKSGKTNIELNAYTGIQKVSNLPHMLNANQYLDVVEQAWNNANPGNATANPYTKDRGRSDFANTDWLKALFETGKISSAELSASGGNEKTNFLLSGSIYQQDGIVVYDNDQFNKMNFRINVNSQLTDRLSVGTNLQMSYSAQDRLSSSGDAPGIIRHAVLRPPVIPIYKNPSDPTYSVEDPFTDLPFYTNPKDQNDWSKYERTSNPIALAHFTNDQYEYYKLFGNVFADYNLLKDKSLIYTMNLGFDVNFGHHKAFLKNFGDDDGNGSGVDAGTGRQNRPTSLNEMREQFSTITWNNLLKYQKTFNRDHNVSVLLGSEYISYQQSGISASREHYDYTSDNFQYIDFGGTQSNLWNGGRAENWALMSYFTSANYDYKGKYMATVNFRADASSKFGPNNQWGYFPSISAGWKISEENFMKPFSGWLSELKLRGSHGTLGNQDIPNYVFFTTYTYDSNNVYKLSRIGNPDIHWEKTTQTDFGFDVSFFNNRLYASGDYYNKLTSGILLPITLPSAVGSYEATYVNSASVKNNGFEFNLGYRNRDHAFKYNVNGNIATLNNNVESLHPFLPNMIGSVTKTEPGHPLNAYFGYVMEGIYQNDTEIKTQLFNDPTTSIVPGDIRFKDLNEDGKIDDKDRTYIGNPIPKITYGINLSGEYKGFDISLFFQGVSKVDRFNEMRKILNYDSRPFNYTTEVLGAWNGEGSSNTIPRVSLNDNGSSKFSSLFIQDASYFRMKNLEIGYSLPKIDGLQFKQVRFYVSAQNVFTVTNYSGLDPESTALIDMGTYPQARTFLAGVNVKF